MASTPCRLPAKQSHNSPVMVTARRSCGGQPWSNSRRASGSCAGDFHKANGCVRAPPLLCAALRLAPPMSRPSTGIKKGSGVRGQGSGIRGQGSGVRGQGSGVRGQGSGVRGQGSGVRGQGSGVRGQGSGVRGQLKCPGTFFTPKGLHSPAQGRAAHPGDQFHLTPLPRRGCTTPSG